MNLFFLRWNDDSNLLLGLGLPSKIWKTQVHDFLCVFRSQHMEGWLMKHRRWGRETDVSFSGRRQPPRFESLKFISRTFR